MIRKWLKSKKHKNSNKGSFVFAPSPNSVSEFSEITDSRDRELANEPVLISFATRDKTYRPCADNLIEACKRFDQHHSIETIPATSRDNACLFKPTFIKFKLLTLGRPVIWLDIDTDLKGKIDIPDGDWDIATLMNKRHSLNDYSSQVIAFRPTIPALRLLELWEQFCSAHWLPGLDHRRFNYAKLQYDSSIIGVDFAPFLKGKIVGDPGSKKEHVF